MTFVENPNYLCQSLMILSASVMILQNFEGTTRIFLISKQFYRFSTFERADINFIAQRSDNDRQQEENDWHLLIFRDKIVWIWKCVLNISEFV